MGYRKQSHSRGFTIVELLVVIVVIGILAAITIVSYTGISQKATVASLTSDLDGASRQIKLYQVTSSLSSYPASLDANYCPVPADSTRCLKPSPGVTYQYSADNSTTPQIFCITATKAGQSYKISNDGAPTPGVCLDYGLVLRVNAGNPASYPGSGTTWTDLSGYNHNGTLLNGVGYSSSNGGVLSFDGVNDYVTLGTGNNYFPLPLFSMCSWAKSPGLAAGTSNPGIIGFTYGLRFNIDDSGRFNTGIDNGSTFVWQNVAGNLFDNAFHHLCLTYDGTNRHMYVDGIEKLSVATTWLGTTRWPLDTVSIGRDNNNSNQVFNGSIGDVRIQNRTLSSDEVSQLFNTLRGRYGI